MTGGAGFIGSALVRRILEREPDARVVVLDALTYAGTRENLEGVAGARCELLVGDVRDRAAVRAACERARPEVLMHLAAETHVDRSIEDAAPFVSTNVEGTLQVLEAARAHRATEAGRGLERVVHVSTDEVLGPAPAGVALREDAPMSPRSPYAASKAGGEALAVAFHATYGLPVVVARPTNHYGPRQLAEKLIPLIICRALLGLSLPVYGDGLHSRDWTFVDDGCDALLLLGARGAPGAIYHLASGEERTTLEVVAEVCGALDVIAPARRPHATLISHVADRPGHDRRYGVDASRAREELGVRPATSFAEGIRTTVASYVEPGALARARAHLERRGRLT